VQHDGGGWRCLAASPSAMIFDAHSCRFFRRDSAAVLIGPPGSLVIDEGNRSDLKCMGPMIRRRERLQASSHSIFALLADTSSRQTMTLFDSISK